MSQINELYQQTILDHNKSPRNFGKLEHADKHGEGFNPLCGDKIDLDIEMDGNVIKDVKFSGSGCAISQASASIMTTLLKGKTREEAKELFRKFHEAVTGGTDEEPDVIDLGKLAVFYGVREFPARIKCASLAWHTMLEALGEEQEIPDDEH